MRSIKRLLSVILAFSMVMSLNTMAFAAETGAGEVPESENAFDCELHDSKKARKDMVQLSVSDEEQMIGNEYIEFFVAQSEYSGENGKFTIGNTGGNPNYTSDDYMRLLFGHPSPWSSYTTIRINNTNYIFMSDKTQYDPDDLKAVSTMEIDGVLVTQTLKIIENEGTGLKDTVQISYTVNNRSGMTKNIGIRIMLDTMLGYNDGAPFKVPSLGNVTRERELVGNAIPAYWQAFDSLTDPSVFAIGTFYKEGDRKPDKVQFTAWGNVYDSDCAWNYSIDPYTDVTYDSAVSIYWNSTSIPSGSSTKVSTYYGVGYANDGMASTEASAEVPSNGFAVQVIDENGVPVEGANVEAANILNHPVRTTGTDGIAVFDSMPVGNGDTRKAQLNVTKDGYQSISGVERTVNKGGLAAVTIYLNDGKVHISSAIGQIDGTTVDLISNYKYFKANSSDIKEADNRSNVKDLEIKVTASGGERISRYQLLQGGDIVAESTTSTIRIPVLTGTPADPNSFGSDWRITKLKAGQVVHLRVVDVNGVASELRTLGIKVSEPTVYGSGDSKGKLSFGEKLKFNVPSGIPIIGDTEIELGWNGLPFVFEVSQSGKVKFAINPKSDPYEIGKVDGTDLSNWSEVEKEYADAMEQVALGRSAAAKKFGGTPQKFGAGKLSVSASIMGYGEGYIDGSGNVIIDVGLVITISEEGSYTWTYFLGYVPVYISIGEKVSVSGSGQVSVIRTNGEFAISGAVGEINPRVTLNVDGGVGVNGVLNIGASGRATLSWLNRWTDDYNRVDLTGGMYLVAKAFLFKAEKKLAEGTWTIYDSYSRSGRQAALMNVDRDFYNACDYEPIGRDYLDAPELLYIDGDTVKANIYPDASPKLVQAGDTAYLFWLDDIPERSDNDRTALVYATSEDCEIWSEPIQVIAEEDSGTADFAFDVCVDGSDIHIALSKANQKFDDAEVDLNQVAASADIYYVKLDTRTDTTTQIQRITDNAFADTMPSVAVNGGQVVIAYVENRMEGGLFGTENTYNVCYQVIGEDTAVTDSVDGLITELDAGVLDGEFAIGYVVDADRDYTTDDDTELWVTTADGSYQVESAGVYTPTFAQIGGSDVLLWYSDGNIHYTTGQTSRTADIFGDALPTTLGHSFYVIGTGDDVKIVWEAMSQDEYVNETSVYAVDYLDGDWSNAYTLFDTDSELTSVLSGYSDGGQSIVAYLRTSGVEYDERVSLCVEKTEPPTEIAVLNVDYAINDVTPGEPLDMSVTVQNCGATTVDSVSVFIDGDEIAVLDNLNLACGAVETYELTDFVVPEWLDYVGTFTLRVFADGDRNYRNDYIDFKIGYTDISLTTNQMLVNGEDWISISVTNDSHMDTDATLRVIADEKDGAVLYEQRLSGITSDSSQAVMLNLNSLSGGAPVDVFYVTVTADAPEVDTTDNQGLIYFGLSVFVKPEISFTEKEQTLLWTGDAAAIIPPQVTGSAQTEATYQYRTGTGTWYDGLPAAPGDYEILATASGGTEDAQDTMTLHIVCFLQQSDGTVAVALPVPEDECHVVIAAYDEETGAMLGKPIMRQKPYWETAVFESLTVPVGTVMKVFFLYSGETPIPVLDFDSYTVFGME